MKLTIDAKTLAESLTAVSQAVAAKTTKPVLAMVRLSLTAGVLSVEATDTEVSVRRVVSAADGTDGVVLVDPNRAASWLKEQSGAVSIERRESAVRLANGAKKLDLPLLDVDEFPAFGDLGESVTTTVTLPYDLLATAIERTQFAADKKEGARWAITGVLFKVAGGVLDVVATDTKRLAKVGIPTTAGDGQALVPLKATTLVLKNGAGDAPEVAVQIAPNAAVFRTDRWAIHTRLVEGKFPPYQQIIPKSLDHTAEVVAGPFAAAVREAAVATTDHAKRIEFQFANEQCVLTAMTAECASESVVDVPGFDGDVSLALDPAYVLDGLKGVDKGEIVRVRMTDANKPVLFHTTVATAVEGVTHVYLAMPMGEKGE